MDMLSLNFPHVGIFGDEMLIPTIHSPINNIISLIILYIGNWSYPASNCLFSSDKRSAK
jgi:hypothetical protein